MCACSWCYILYEGPRRYETYFDRSGGFNTGLELTSNRSFLFTPEDSTLRTAYFPVCPRRDDVAVSLEDLLRKGKAGVTRARNVKHTTVVRRSGYKSGYIGDWTERGSFRPNEKPCGHEK